MVEITEIDANGMISIFDPWGRNYLTPLVDDSYETISLDVKKGIISLTSEPIELQILERPPKRGSETNQHRLLKANAAKLLEDLGEENIEFESFDNSDVYGFTKRIRIECGHTDGVRYFRSLWTVKEFWVLQYPYGNEPSQLYKFKIDYNRLIEEYPEGKHLVSKDRLNQFL